MSQYGWNNCPETGRNQVNSLVCEIQRHLTDNLIGVYLHGSLAMGCFNPKSSDIDLLVISKRGMSIETKRKIAQLFLQHSKAPYPVEVSFLRESDLESWRHPIPFDLHYGEDWRKGLLVDLSTEKWKRWNDKQYRDEDLAAHITVTLHRGICLWGKPIKDVFPPVPKEDYTASLLADIEWAKGKITQNPIYLVLNMCRVYAYLHSGKICSKDEGGRWALGILPENFQALITRALEVYRGNSHDVNFDEKEMSSLTEYLENCIANSCRK